MPITIAGQTFLTQREAMGELGVKTYSTFASMMPDIPFQWKGKRRIYKPADLLLYVENTRVEPCQYESRKTVRITNTTSVYPMTDAPTGLKEARAQLLRSRH